MEELVRAHGSTKARTIGTSTLVTASHAAMFIRGSKHFMYHLTPGATAQNAKHQGTGRPGLKTLPSQGQPSLPGPTHPLALACMQRDVKCAYANLYAHMRYMCHS
eukprot:1478220-Amphidinium_carterae.1